MKDSLLKVYYPVKDYLLIILGTALYGFGYNAFILSNEIVTGGLSGICGLIFFATKLPVSISYFAINVLLLGIAFKILGFKFLVKTILGVASLSFWFWFFELVFAGQPLMQLQEVFMSVIIGAMICGSGLGLVFYAGGSTGGTDIIVAIINKYKDISIGMGMVLLDFVIVSSSYLLFHNFDKIVLGLIEMGVNSYMLDRVMNANTQSVQFMIFSRKYDEIADAIIHRLQRGCTILEGEGGYSHKPIKVIVLVARNRERTNIFRLIKMIDSHAFISQSTVRGVYGEGFDAIKV